MRPWRLLILLLVVAACARRGVTRMAPNYVGSRQPLGGNLELNVERSGQGDTAHYDLFVHWTGLYRIDLRGGQSLVVTVDSQRTVYSAGEKDVYNDMQCGNGPCLYDDRAYYPVTVQQLRAIARARVVTVEVIGARQRVERDFNEDNFERFRAFVDEHVTGT